jgi:hypothetical protein
LKNLEPTTAPINTHLSWNFQLKSNPPAQLKLYKDNKDVMLNDRINLTKIESSEFDYDLVIKNIEANDIGLYKVIATNKIGNSNTIATLSVSGAPVFIRKPNQEVSAIEKKTVKVEYEITGIPQPDIQWLIFENLKVFKITFFVYYIL